MSYPCASTNVRYSSAERLGARDLQGVGIGKELRPEILRLAVREALGAIAPALDLDAVDEHDPLTGRRIFASRNPDLPAARTATDAAALPRHRGVGSCGHERKLARFVDRTVDRDQHRVP